LGETEPKKRRGRPSEAGMRLRSPRQTGFPFNILWVATYSNIFVGITNGL
jgi:hypothetical protein